MRGGYERGEGERPVSFHSWRLGRNPSSLQAKLAGGKKRRTAAAGGRKRGGVMINGGELPLASSLTRRSKGGTKKDRWVVKRKGGEPAGKKRGEKRTYVSKWKNTAIRLRTLRRKEKAIEASFSERKKRVWMEKKKRWYPHRTKGEVLL